jgi:hypothetical protein
MSLINKIKEDFNLSVFVLFLIFCVSIGSLSLCAILLTRLSLMDPVMVDDYCVTFSDTVLRKDELISLMENTVKILKGNFSQIDDYCQSTHYQGYILNISNPASYINKYTKKFLIELVRNATFRNEQLYS